MAEATLCLTVTAPVLDRVVVDSPTLRWWTQKGHLGHGTGGFETVLRIAPEAVRIAEPGSESSPQIVVWRGDTVIGAHHVGTSGDPPFLLDGLDWVTFPADPLPDRFQFLWPRLGLDVSWVLSPDERAELSRLRAQIPAVRWVARHAV